MGRFRFLDWCDKPAGASNFDYFFLLVMMLHYFAATHQWLQYVTTPLVLAMGAIALARLVRYAGQLRRGVRR